MASCSNVNKEEHIKCMPLVKALKLDMKTQSSIFEQVDECVYLIDSSGIYKGIKSGRYYLKFMYNNPDPIDKKDSVRIDFVVLLDSSNQYIPQLKEDRIQYVWGYLTDSNYLFELRDCYECSEYKHLPISILKGACYFKNSDYRVKNGILEYKNGRGINYCNSPTGTILKLGTVNIDEVNIIDTNIGDCAVVGDKVYLNGCLLTSLVLEKHKVYIHNTVKPLMKLVEDKKYKTERLYF